MTLKTVACPLCAFCVPQQGSSSAVYCCSICRNRVTPRGLEQDACLSALRTQRRHRCSQDVKVEGKYSLMMLRQRHVAHHPASNGPGDQVQQRVEEPAAHDTLQTHPKPSLPALLLIIGTFAVTVRVFCPPCRRGVVHWKCLALYFSSSSTLCPTRK